MLESGPGRTWEVELKLVGDGDSLRGFSYYQGAWYRRLVMQVKGFVNPSDGSLSLWHDSPYGIDEKGRRTPDPMPPGIHYRLGFNREDDRTETLKGTVSMSNWSRERWERGVRLERAADEPFLDEWIESLMEKGKKETPPKTSSAGPKAGKKSAPPIPAKQSNPVAVGSSMRPAGPSPSADTPLVKDEPTVVKPAFVQKAPEKPLSVKDGTISGKQVVPDKPIAASAIKLGKDTLSTSTKTAKPHFEEKSPQTTSPTEDDARNETIRPPMPVAPDALLPPMLSRERILLEEIAVQGDTLWLNFYDPAEVDGDTVSIYLGSKPIAERVGLGLDPHIIGIPVASLPENVELTMYAENMGRLPPNTALLILYMKGERREIRLESTDRVSATIRLKKQNPSPRR